MELPESSIMQKKKEFGLVENQNEQIAKQIVEDQSIVQCDDVNYRESIKEALRLIKEYKFILQGRIKFPCATDKELEGAQRVHHILQRANSFQEIDEGTFKYTQAAVFKILRDMLRLSKPALFGCFSFYLPGNRSMTTETLYNDMVNALGIDPSTFENEPVQDTLRPLILTKN